MCESRLTLDLEYFELKHCLTRWAPLSRGKMSAKKKLLSDRLSCLSEQKLIFISFDDIGIVCLLNITEKGSENALKKD